MIKFEAEIKPAGENNGAYVIVPYDIPSVFGKKGMVPVIAKIDGVEYRGSLSPMLKGCHVLGILKHIREKIGKSFGDIVSVELVQDTAERKIEIPDDLFIALKPYPDLMHYFEKLSYTHKKEYVTAILEAKKAETRVRRIDKMLEKLEKQLKEMELKRISRQFPNPK